MAAEKIRIGVIGAGANTCRFHIPNLLAQSNVEIAAVANRSLSSGAKVAERFGIPRVAETWEDIVYDDGIDAVCIGTWPNMHAPLTIAALDSGKHVLCEARMAMNSMEAHAMFEASRMHPRLAAQIVPAPQTLEFDRTIIELIGEGYIGDLVAVDVRIAEGSDFPDMEGPAHWRHDRDLSGNNIMFLGIWYEIVMRWLGPASTVQAVAQNVVKYRRRGDGARAAMTIPDHIDVICTMEQGGQMRMTVSTVLGRMTPTDIHICGTEGTLRLTDETGKLALTGAQRRNKRLAPLRVPKGKRGRWRVEEEFINAVRGRESVSLTDFATGVKYMEWTDAVTRATRTGTRVHLPLDVEY